MQEPDDFGCGPVETLAHVADPTPVPKHSVFWSAWFEEVTAFRPELRLRADPDPSDTGATHEFDSLRGVRIGCRLVEPPESAPVRGVVIALHGYHVDTTLEQDAKRLARLGERGLAVLLVRVRGYPGSQADTGDLTTPPASGRGWITRGLAAPDDSHTDAMTWILPQGVADVVNACRVVRRWLNEHHHPPGEPRPPIMLLGESFGAGLAVIATAKLSGRLVGEEIVSRLAIGLPSLGDWPWRLAHRAGTGAGAEIADVLRRHAAREEVLVTRLRLCDTAVHAARVRTPTLCKLALCDDVVPAPSAAGVFNALGVDPGLKWRFLVPYGHFDGGLASNRRHALFDRCVRDFLDPAALPAESMEPWEALMYAGDRPPDDAGPTGEQTTLPFGADDPHGPDDDEESLKRAYAAAGRTLDSLPYTDEFEALYNAVSRDEQPTRREVFHRLHNMRKAGHLPRLGRAPDRPPALSGEEEALLTRLVVETVGSLGHRDRLPYTPDFDRLVERFHAETGRELSRHDAWRLVARLAK